MIKMTSTEQAGSSVFWLGMKEEKTSPPPARHLVKSQPQILTEDPNASLKTELFLRGTVHIPARRKDVSRL